MFKRTITFIISVLFLINLYGCVALFAGAAGGAGTASWLSQKLSQEVNASKEKCLRVTRTALNSLKLPITKEIKKQDVIQVKGKYSDGRTLWVDIRPITTSSSRIDVRVGAVSDKEAARKILDRILRYL